ncbi:uridine kinase [Bacillus sp. FJAT-21945]|nr:uridine kinase [Bacillus sp. FJAT-21945]
MTNEEITKGILINYSARISKQRPFIVAFDGLSGVGKTTLVHRIDRELRNNGCKVVIIHIDDHIVERNKRYDTGYEEWYEYYYLQWDVNLLSTDLFRKLHNNKNDLILPFYNHSEDTLTLKKISIPNDSIILIEGIFLLRKEWRSFYDYTIFLDCPRDVRYERVLKRDSYIGDYQERLNKYKRRYWPGEGYYLEGDNPIGLADLVIDSIE